MNDNKVRPFDLDYAIQHPEEVCDKTGTPLNYVEILVSPKSSPNSYVVCCKLNDGLCKLNDGPRTYTKDGKWFVFSIEPYLYLLDKDPIAQGRNPQKVTVSQLGVNYRLATDEDMCDSRIEYWKSDLKTWKMRSYSNIPLNLNNTYRVPTTPLPLRYCGPEDFPPGTAIRKTLLPDGYYRMVTAVSRTTIETMNQDAYSFSDKDFMQNYERLLPGTTQWLPCHK